MGTQWGQVKGYWGLMSVEGPSHSLRGAAQKQELCHGPSMSSKPSKASPACHTAWPGQGLKCPGDCRDPWDQAKAPQGCSWCHTRDVCVLGTRSRAFPAAAKEGLPAEHQGTAWGAPTCCVWLSPCLCSDSNPAAEGQGAGHVPGAGQHLIPGLLRTGHEGSWLSLRQPHRYGGAQRGSFKGLTETTQTKAR